MISLKNLNNKKILILGLGKEGVDNFFFIKKHIDYKTLGIADRKAEKNLSLEVREALNENVTKHFGENYLSKTHDYDVIIKSPGIPLSFITKKEGQKITSQSDIFLSNYHGKVIGVTGTKGKSTTCYLINEILKEEGKSVHLIGNMGRPALEYLLASKEDDFFVYELSSFQLETVTESPDIAIYLNFYPDHLDHHKNLEEYALAKEKITKYQSAENFFLYNKNDKIVCEAAEKSLAKKIPFKEQAELLFKISEIIGTDKEKVDEITKNFKGLEHRMEYVGNYRGINFYNDSAATIPQATVRAIDSLGDEIGTIIIGGSEKGSDYDILVEKIKEKKIENIIIFRGTKSEVGERLKFFKKNVFFVSDMKEAVAIGLKKTKKRKACLLSPGFASFNMFKNYIERGNLFKEYIIKQNAQ